jgi:hypothetical protein
MPGPVSDSFNPDPWVEDWKHDLGDNGFRFFVLKAQDVFDALDEEDLYVFNQMLKKIEKHREKVGKRASKSYWVYCRQWPHAKVIRSMIEALLGHKIGETYRID